MVFLSFLRYAARGINRGPEKFWRVQQYLRFAWRYRGRKRTNYRIGMRYVHKALMKSTLWRQEKKRQMKLLWNIRLEAACQEHSISREVFLEGLARSNIQLDRKVLTDLAIYEPRTFQSLTEIAKKQMKSEGLEDLLMPRPHQVLTRGML